MIYVVRHGQTDHNKEERLQGRNGLPLNDTGVRQAERVRERLVGIEFDFVYSSPQERAVETAKISTGMMPIIDQRLDVYDLGEADGLRKHEVELDGILPDRNVYRGMEDLQSFIERVFSFMKELKKNAGDRDFNILISGHRCTTGAVGSYFEGIPRDKNILRYSSNNGDYKLYSF
ncbi:histidine phosphatase family protein [Rossellomorea aquimaris]|uniref:histidine phosphatase family protein n=1 Tax=Rossellomorea aquimaris TaxID=189382 RepID=UPI001CD1B7A1|nr:histidine phosphatase family protein [Rossellomorea aquimaris]MCA1053733.1 histidine phosphatase family protein [Rossellomorea aquimaris]